jgi:hypothetical protein
LPSHEANGWRQLVAPTFLNALWSTNSPAHATDNQPEIPGQSAFREGRGVTRHSGSDGGPIQIDTKRAVESVPLSGLTNFRIDAGASNSIAFIPLL